MSLLIKRLNEAGQGSSLKALNASFIISLFCHICVFSFFYIALPTIDRNRGFKDIVFVGSFLRGYDFDAGAKSGLKKNDKQYLIIAKQNALALSLSGVAKLNNILDKPKNYSAIKNNDFEFYSSFEERFINLNADIKNFDLSERDFFDVKNLPDLSFYFKEGIPRPIKFDLFINDRGRVEFINKLISSGSFDADMFVQRNLRRFVFDTHHFGYNHRRALELDLKK